MVDPLDRALAALGPVPPPPPGLAARALAAAEGEEARRSHRRRTMRRMSFAAALTLAFGVTVLVWPSRSAAQAVTAAVNKLKDAKGLKIVVRTTEKDRPDRVSTYWHFGTKERIEGETVKDEGNITYVKAKTVDILDGAVGIRLTLDENARTARRSLLSAVELKAMAGMASPAAHLAEQAADARDWIGEDFAAKPGETIDGRKVKVYAAGNGRPYRLAAYVDAESEVLRRSVEVKDGKTTTHDFTLLDTAPDPKLFDLTIPAGYTLIDPAAKPAPTADDHYTHAMKRLTGLPAVRLTAHWDHNPGENSKAAPRTYYHAVTLSGSTTRIDVKALPGMPGLKLGTATIDQTYLYEQVHVIDEIDATSGAHVRRSAPGRLLYANHVTKRAWTNGSLGVPYMDLPKFLGELAAAPGQHVGVDRIDGAACDVYQVPAAGTLVWVAREKELPVKVALREGNRLVAMLDGFDYAPEVDAALFDFAVPAGYEAVKR